MADVSVHWASIKILTENMWRDIDVPTISDGDLTQIVVK